MVIAKVGEQVRLVCPIISGSHLLVQWTKDGETVDDTWPAFRITSRTLKVKAATESLSGVYQCRGISGYGTAQHEIKLIVLGSHGADSGMFNDGSRNSNNERSRYSSLAPPKIVQKSPSSPILLKMAASNVRMKCTSTGVPKPTIRWFKDGVQVIGFSGGRVDTSISGQLSILALTAVDAGLYECRAMNALGIDKGTFTVQIKDAYNGKPRIIAASLTNATVYSGDAVSVECQVQSESPVHIKWLKRLHSVGAVPSVGESATGTDSYNLASAVQLIKGNRYLVLNTTAPVRVSGNTYTSRMVMTSTQVTDTGQYVCLAANSGGLAMRDAHIIVLDNRHDLQPRTNSFQSEVYVIVAAPVIVVVVLSLAGLLCLCRRKSHSQASEIHKHSNNPILMHPRDTLISLPSEKQRANVLLVPEAMGVNGENVGVYNNLQYCTHDRRYDPLPPHPTPTPSEHTYNVLMPVGSGSSRSSARTASLRSSCTCHSHCQGQCMCHRSLTPTSSAIAWPSPALPSRDYRTRAHVQYAC